jgi:hypothetical protein
VSTAGGEYSAFVAAQLAEERTTKTSLETRGITVITTSGGLVTLLFGLVALSTKSAATSTLPVTASNLLVAAALFLTLAAVFGLLTNWAMSYTEASIEGLQELLTRDWKDTQAQGQLDVASTVIDILGTSRAKNERKANLLRLAMSAEIVGVFFVALAAVAVLTT